MLCKLWPSIFPINRKIYIEIEEYNPICIYKDKLVLSSTTSVDGKNDSSVVDERTVDHSFCGNCGTKLA